MDIGSATIVITGASSGIGRATALACGKRGANVVLAARPSAALDEAAAACRAEGGTALAVATDVSDQDSVERLARRAVERFGRMDVWINNAAVMAYGSFEDTPAHVHRRVIESNLLGQIHGARAVLPVFRRQGRGTLINVASQYGRMTSPYVSAYATSKFGILGFSEVLRQELHGAKDIHICAVLPGSIDTPIFRHAADYVGRRPKPVPPVSSPERVARAILRTIEHPRRRVKIGWTHRLAAVGHTLFPRTYGRLAPPVMRLTGLAREPSDHTDGNVFEPMPDWNRVHGGWRNRRLRVAAPLAAMAVAWAWSRR